MVASPTSVSISGTTQVGQTLTATVVGTPDSGYTASYLWQRSTDSSTWAVINGASTNTYTLTKADANNVIRVIANYVKRGSASSNDVASSPTSLVTITKETTPNNVAIASASAIWGTDITFTVDSTMNYRLVKDNGQPNDVSTGITLSGNKISATQSGTVKLQAQKKGSSTTADSDWSSGTTVTFLKQDQTLLTPLTLKGVWGTDVQIQGVSNRNDATGTWIYRFKSLTGDEAADNGAVTVSGLVSASSSGKVLVDISRTADIKYNAIAATTITVEFDRKPSGGTVTTNVLRVRENTVVDLKDLVLGENDQTVTYEENSDPDNIGVKDGSKITIGAGVHNKSATYDIKFAETKKYKAITISVKITTIDRLDVITRYRTLIEASTDDTSIYKDTIDHLENLLNSGTIDSVQKGEIITNVLGGMVNTITSSSMQTALAWAKAETEVELTDAKIRESHAVTHKVIADTYTNFGTFNYNNVSAGGVSGVSPTYDANTHKTLSKSQQNIAVQQAKGYAWNAWANAASSASAMLRTAIGTGVTDFDTKGSVGKTLLDAVNDAIKNLNDVDDTVG